MAYAKTQNPGLKAVDVIDFDEILLAACSAWEQAELLREAELLASAFAPGKRPDDLRRMATQLSAGDRDAEIGRPHARRLAAALKHLSKAG